MKKRIICIMMATVMAFSVTGCGKKNKKNTEDENTTAAVETETKEEETVEVSDAEVEEETSSDDTGSEFLDVYTTVYDFWGSDPENDVYEYFDYKYTEIKLSDADAQKYPELNKALDEMNKTNKGYADQGRKTFTSYYEDYGIDEYFSKYETTDILKVLRADKTVLSYLDSWYDYEGGAHGMYTLSGGAIDVATGKVLRLSDVVTDENAFKKEICNKLLEKYDDIVFQENIEEYCREIDLNNEYVPGWSIDYTGVTLYFQPYELASFADGILSVRFSFAEDGKLIDEKYFDVPDEYIIPIPEWDAVYADVDNDGDDEEINLRQREEYYGDDYEYSETKWVIIVDGEEFEGCPYSYSNNSFLVYSGGKYYAYMFDISENDYAVLNIIDLAAGKKVGDEYGFGNYGLTGGYDWDDDYSADTTIALTNPKNIVLGSRMNILSTYGATRTYHVDSNGGITSDEAFIVDFGALIKPVEDMECDIIDKDGNVVNKGATLPKGTMLRIVRTDGESYVDLQSDDFVIEENEEEFYEDYPYTFTSDPLNFDSGTFYRLYIEEGEYGEILINGEETYWMFEGTVYAG